MILSPSKFPGSTLDLLTPDLLIDVSGIVRQTILSERAAHPIDFRILLLGIIGGKIQIQYGQSVVRAIEQILTQTELDRIIDEIELS